MRFGSVCSGIEAASAACSELGWEAAWVAEVDAAASLVLAYRFPGVPNLGDMTLIAERIRRGEIEAPDMLVGGTPCQSFSVAGLRGGLADARGQLTLAFIDLANAIDEVRAARGLPPVIIVWENVPGVLNHADNPFGCLLAGLAGDDDAAEPGERPAAGKTSAFWTWDKAGFHRPKWSDAGCAAGPQRAVAWRILDAQWFGLAQRRRRVFVVASARAGFDPATILLEFDGVRRDSPPSREAQQDAARAVAGSPAGGRQSDADNLGVGLAAWVNPVCPTLRAGGISTGGDHPPGTDVDTVDSLIVGAVPTWWDGSPVSQTLDAVLYKGQAMPEKNRFPAVLQPVTAFSSKDHGSDATSDCAPTLRASGHADSHANGGSPPAVAYAIQERAVSTNPAAPPQGSGIRDDDCAYTLEARHHVQAVVYAFDTTQITSPGNYSAPRAGDPCHPLAAGAHPPAVCVTGSVTHTLRADGFDASEDGTGRGQPIVCHGTQDPCTGNLAYALGRNNGGENVILSAPIYAVRRLMPVECERLQGFPDGWTDVPTTKGKRAADGPRYKQLGNSMAVKVMRWIGHRIDAALHAPALGHNGGPALFEDVLG